MKFILGKKIGMTQIFGKEGQIVPVTLIEAGPCFVTQIKNKEKDGYNAVQIGFEKIEKKNKIKKTMKGKEFKFLREEKLEDVGQFKIGSEMNINIFKEGEDVKISGITKGKGFQGAVKRWGFKGKDATHGVKHEQRKIGSVGFSVPERVVPGKKMPGRTGGRRKTVKNLEVVQIDPSKNLLIVKGAVQGRKGTLLEIKSEKLKIK